MRRYLPFVPTPPLVSVVRLTGMIASGQRGLSDQGAAPALERAFAKGKPSLVALVINSPGGSPVQSSLIGKRIRRLSEEKKVPTVAFVEDVAASGGYWLAAAADEIIVDESSIVGSIGVISASFGFQELLEKIGVERRVHTAGTSKSFLDPFRPEDPDDVSRLKDLQEQIHGTFIDHVKGSRGAKLTSDLDLFNGQVFVGQKAVDVGLADGLGQLVPEMKSRFGDKVRFAVYGERRSVLQRLGLGRTGLIGDLDAWAAERAAFARFGL